MGSNGGKPKLEGTFHRRTLPAPAVAFGSAAGRRLFAAALAEGNMNGYFNLAEHYCTQGHPAFCGLGSLNMALNALLVDPQRVWQGVWRWFDESMLDCCEPHDVIRLQGITLPKVACLARCNGAEVTLKYGDSVTLSEFRKDVKRVCSLRELSETSSKPGHETDQELETGGGEAEVKAVMICSYNRRTLNQTGTGHFSPIGGYEEKEDMVLIMDVARFKYPPHWVPLKELYRAMQPVDPDTGRPRGYLLLTPTEYLYRKCSCGPDGTEGMLQGHCGEGKAAEGARKAATGQQLHRIVCHECTLCKHGPSNGVQCDES